MRKPIVPPPVWALLFGALMWQLHRRVPLATVLVPPATWPGALAPSTASALVTEGLCRWTHNPMYGGLLLVLCGWALWLGTLSPWLGPPLFVALLTLVQIRPEKAALRTRFGAAYGEYCGRVPRWIG